MIYRSKVVEMDNLERRFRERGKDKGIPQKRHVVVTLMHEFAALSRDVSMTDVPEIDAEIVKIQRNAEELRARCERILDVIVTLDD